MIVRIRGVEIVCESLEELDRLLERYGEAGAITAGPQLPSPGRSGGAPPSVDMTLLRALIGAPAGIPSPTVQGMLGARGKGIATAFKAWCGRMHLPPDAVEQANPRGKRGWRLTEAGQHAARAILGN